MHVGGGGVAWFAGVDDDHRAALAPELERGGESGGRSADNGDVTVALDGAVFVFVHWFDNDARSRRAQGTLRYMQEETEGSERWLS